jgi:hypothetical protein
LREKNKKYRTSKTIIAFHIWVLLNSIILAQSYGNWTEIDSLNIARVGHAMVVLPNGNVLVSGSEVDSIQTSAEIYDITTGEWRYTAPMKVARAFHSLVLLNTGQVLAIGGYKEQSCELFDPITELWSMTDSIPTFRFDGQTVTELLDGRIMVAGGYYVDTTSWDFVILNKVDISNLVTETWIEATPMNLERYEHTATLLNDGRVLIAGGETDNFTTDQCDIYEPTFNMWSIVAPMNEKRSSHASKLLLDGTVLVCGGSNEFSLAMKSCERYHQYLNQWNLVDDMLDYRLDHQVYFLSKINKLLILGGAVPSLGTEDSWEIFDPDSLTPLYLASFPINQLIVDNNVQLVTENIMVSGGWEFLLNPMPVFWSSLKTWIYDIATNVTQDNNHQQYFSLNQNYPNPFNPSTTISYIIQSISKVELKVFDLLGKEISSSVNENQPAGEYRVNFNAGNLSSGIYYYRLTTSNSEKSDGKTFQQTKKMVLIR